MAEQKVDMSEALKEISSSGLISAKEGPKDFSKAAALTQHAINNLGGPVYASMTDSKPVDTGLNKALTDMAIQSKGESSVNVAKAPADRAITEALTMKAIASNPSLKKTEGAAASDGLSADQLKALQAQAQEEKDAAAAAKTFGGGDAKEGMGSILKEISEQGGAISVPTAKANIADVSMSHTKTLMQISSIKEGASGLTATAAPADKTLTQAKMMMEISHKGETSANHDKVAALDSKSTESAKTIMSLVKKSSLKPVDKPAEGLSKEQLTALQAAAAEEKK